MGAAQLQIANLRFQIWGAILPLPNLQCATCNLQSHPLFFPNLQSAMCNLEFGRWPLIPDLL
jgi:hypothetical protein